MVHKIKSKTVKFQVSEKVRFQILLFPVLFYIPKFQEWLFSDYFSYYTFLSYLREMEFKILVVAMNLAKDFLKVIKLLIKKPQAGTNDFNLPGDDYLCELHFYRFISSNDAHLE